MGACEPQPKVDAEPQILATSWLVMERNGLPRRRGQDAAPRPARPPARTTRDRRHQNTPAPEEKPQPNAFTSKIRTRKTNDEKEKASVPTPAPTRPLLASPPGGLRHSRHFTVGNVGTGGALYLKPTQHGQPVLKSPTARIQNTLTDTRATSAGKSLDRLSGQTTTTIRAPYLERSRSVRSNSHDQRAPVRPSLVGEGHQPGRARSHSFSTMSEHMRASLSKPSDARQSALDGRRLQRRKSSTDLPSGLLLDLQIPHYRLGTPRFTERGTAYLHNSTYTSSSSGIRSSVLADGDYDKLFPAPPSGLAPSRISRRSSAARSFLHPSSAYLARPTPRRGSPSSRPMHKETITPTIFDWLEKNLHDPTVVQYHPSTGRVFAATPARLIAQITSPQFLDYELLADFFLTFRCFMVRHDVLEYLLARMQWAFDNTAEAGRIVRVRTFVALRHWILNYFSDDFLPDWRLRKRFCDLVNGLTSTLLQRSDQGGSDLNILGELKKCWRRTCALFWRAPDALSTSADVDIVPGGEEMEHPAMDSVVSLPLTIRPTTRSASVFEMTKLPMPVDRTSMISSTTDSRSTVASSHPRVQSVRFGNPNIPASPMSEESLDVLSCSVPFLRHLRPTHHSREKSTSSSSSQHPPLSGRNASRGHKHKRSGSFSDALRDKRNPIHSLQPESIDVNDLPDFTFTGGLVRGILLQPSPARVYPPLPRGQDQNADPPAAFYSLDAFSDRRYRNPGVKGLVGDVRRALSSRHKPGESPVRMSRSASSSESRVSVTLFAADGEQSKQGKMMRQKPKQDVLAAVIEQSYQNAFQEVVDIEGPLPEAPEPPANPHGRYPSFLLAGPGHTRGESRITAGSRSILIFDDTGGFDVPFMSGGLYPQPFTSDTGSSHKSVHEREQFENALVDDDFVDDSTAPDRSTGNDRDNFRWQSFDEHFKDLAETAPRKANERGSNINGAVPSPNLNARKSSVAQPENLDLSPNPNPLRRRPGGDLKTAIHVHELENLARAHHSIATFSSLHPSSKQSAIHSRNMSDVTHWYRKGSDIRRQPANAASGTASLALLESQRGQSNLRPSFAAQLSQLKGIPDRDSYMGIEDALMKLEGKIPSPSKSTFSGNEHDSGAEIPGFQRKLPAALRNLATSSAQTGRFTPDGPSPTLTETQGASIFHVSDSGKASIDSRINPAHTSHAAASSTSVIPLVRDTRFSGRHGSAVDPGRPPNSSHSHRSFFLNDNESLSDISTEIADPDDLGFRTFFFDESKEDATLPANPFLPPPIVPPAFGLEFGQYPSLHVTSPSTTHLNGYPTGDGTRYQRTLMGNEQPQGQFYLMDTRRNTQVLSSLDPDGHMPFVLAFDPDVIAEQLTIIEKDALDEVDWKDLIGLNWQQNPHHIRNWVDYLKRETSNGIDILIARFNLVVKWVISEIVLLPSPRERARTITRFIHIADHTHRLHNYASLYQITLALLSSDLAGLRKTWALVGTREKQRLAQLELLCQPIRNFHNLRAEMETTSPDVGCIPFIGLYTHDLMLNSQRPARIAPPIPAAEPLINFERFQNTAAIVKSLLRLIEASAKYVFRPHPEVLSRCLWIAALEDGDIAVRCAGLERS